MQGRKPAASRASRVPIAAASNSRAKGSPWPQNERSCIQEQWQEVWHRQAAGSSRLQQHGRADMGRMAGSCMQTGSNLVQSCWQPAHLCVCMQRAVDGAGVGDHAGQRLLRRICGLACVRC